MKKLSLPAASGDYHEVKKEDLNYILDSATEMVKALGRTLKPSGANTVVLSGCRIIESLTSVEIEEGFIFHNDEIYRVMPSDFVFPGGLDVGVDPLENVWLVPEEQSLPNADRVYRDARTQTVFVETAMKISGSATGAFFRLDALSYFANTAPKGTIRFWRPPSGVSLADVCRLPSGKGKGEFLGWQLVGESGGRTLMGMNWNESEVEDVRLETDYQDINELGGKKKVQLTANESGLRNHVVGIPVEGTADGDGVGATVKRGNSQSGTVVSFGVANVDGVSGRDGAQAALTAHENRMPYMMAYIWEKI